MKKVLVVATSRKTRGGITSVIKAHETGEQWKKFHCHWVQTHRDGPTWRKLWYFATGLADFLLRLPFYDIVHIHVSQPTTIKRKNIFLKLAKRFNKNIIIHFHAFNIDDTIIGTHKKGYERFFDNADRIIVLSNWWKEQLSNHLNINDSAIDVIYNPCPEINSDITYSKRKSILYAGTVNQRKGYADLIKAFAKSNAPKLGWSLNIAGNGEIEEGKRLAKSLGIENQVNFLGWVSGEAKDKAFKEASIFCLPSYAEGFPMAVLDAWAYGLSVVTTPVGGIPDVAIDGENMLLFNPGDIDALATQLQKCIDNEDLRNSLSKESTKLAKTTFSLKEIEKQLNNIYTDI